MGPGAAGQGRRREPDRRTSCRRCRISAPRASSMRCRQARSRAAVVTTRFADGKKQETVTFFKQRRGRLRDAPGRARRREGVDHRLRRRDQDRRRGQVAGVGEAARAHPSSTADTTGVPRLKYAIAHSTAPIGGDGDERGHLSERPRLQQPHAVADADDREQRAGGKPEAGRGTSFRRSTGSVAHVTRTSPAASAPRRWRYRQTSRRAPAPGR